MGHFNQKGEGKKVEVMIGKTVDLVYNPMVTELLVHLFVSILF